jgi:hypothetical protein
MAERHPKNAPGPFYATANDDCTQCGVPEFEAASLIGHDDRGCYFQRQPETALELAGALAVCFGSCVSVHRYGGSDPEILRRFAEAREQKLCDVTVAPTSLVLRGHARFSFPQAIDARGVAGEIAHAYEQTFSAAKLTEPVRGGKDRATFGCLLGVQVHRYSVERVARVGSISTAYRDSDLGSLWLLVATTHVRSIRLHQMLVNAGAGDVRWFTKQEWAQNSGGRPYPF